MRALFSVGGTVLSAAAYHLYCVATKVLQWPRLWSERRPRFLQDETVRPAQGGRFALVVKYARFGVTADFLDLLKSLEAAQINTIVVCNGALDPAAHERLRPHAHRILVRRNLGRDFGAYRAATLYLSAQGLQPARMLYLNDSVFYLKGQPLDDMVAALVQSDYDVAGTFENHELSHHLGSYTLSLDGRVFNDPKVLRFWRQYAPYDLRPHAIRRGEIALSRLLKRLNYRTDTLYGIEKLTRLVHQLDMPQLLALLPLMPPRFRHQPLASLMGQSLAALDMVPAISAAATARRVASAPTPLLSAYRQSATQAAAAGTRLRTLVPSQRPGLEAADLIARQSLIDQLLQQVRQGSQIHLGFGLYRKLMQCPIVKKDLVGRGIYTDADCEMMLQDIEPDERQRLVRELSTRDRVDFARGLMKFKFRHGLI